MVFIDGWSGLGVGIRIDRRLVVLKIVHGEVFVVKTGLSEVLGDEVVR
jgi:hypothetical protein